MKIEWTDKKIEAVKQWLEMFVNKHDVDCGESVVQSDSINLDCVDFVAELIDLVEPSEIVLEGSLPYLDFKIISLISEACLEHSDSGEDSFSKEARVILMKLENNGYEVVKRQLN